MKVFHSESHRLHFPQAELSGGQFVTPFERPARVEYILNRLKQRGLRDIADPGPPHMATACRRCSAWKGAMRSRRSASTPSTCWKVS